MSVRVVLADDHVIFREGLKVLLENNGVVVVGEAGNGAQAVEVVRSCRPQVVVMDLSMPGMNGIEAAAKIHQESGIPIILLTVHSEESVVRRALEAGITGYVLKTKAASDLVRAIHEVQSGSIYLSAGIPDIVSGEMPKKDPVMTDMALRGREVLQRIAAEKTDSPACWASVWEPAASSGFRFMEHLEMQKWTRN